MYRHYRKWKHVSLGSTRLRVLQVLALALREVSHQVSLGTTRLRVLQVLSRSMIFQIAYSFIRYDPLEGTASVLAGWLRVVYPRFIRYDPLEGTAIQAVRVERGVELGFIRYD